jgi:molybdopterin-containing oxidoreductase family molybdopterin binding subunit
MPYPDENGMLVPGRWFFPGLHAPSCKEEEIKIPAADMGLKGTFPYVGMPATPGWTDQEEMWQKLGLPFRPQMLINYGCNSVMSNAAPEIVLNNFKKIPLIVSFDLFITEFSESLADLVLPDTSYLEQLTLEGVVPIFNMAYGLHPWSYHIRQPVVEPLFERRQCVEVLIEITKRIGIYENFINVANWFFGIEEPYKLDPKRDYRWADICDAHLKSNFGPEHGLKWFKKHGGMIWPKKVEEAYWRPFINARVPVYFDFLKKFGEKARKLLEPRGINIEWEQYTALIDWFSCPPHKVGDSTCDLYAFSYRDVVHTGTWTMQLPWIDEVSVRNPYTYTIALSEDTGKKKGIKDGDIVYLESASGRKVKGVAKLMQGIHPSTVALAACSGHWSKGLPIAKGKGTHYNTLMDSNITTHDPIAHGMETCVKVKIYKA